MCFVMESVMLGAIVGWEERFFYKHKVSQDKQFLDFKTKSFIHTT